MRQKASIWQGNLHLEVSRKFKFVRQKPAAYTEKSSRRNGKTIVRFGIWLESFCEQENIMLNSSSLSVRGCLGQPMLLFWKLVDETQISKPPEPTTHHIQWNYGSFYPSELIYLFHFNMRYPVGRSAGHVMDMCFICFLTQALQVYWL